MYFEIALIAYIIDHIWGEFKFIRHPVVVMGNYISYFEKKFYKESIFVGALLTLSLLTLVSLISLTILSALYIAVPPFIETLILGILASTAIASKMLYDSVKDIIDHPQNIKYLVSRDTKELSQSNINKAAIETYAENLSDGVIAPLLYLLCFGILGVFIYKAINTLDSIVGYRNTRYEKFGKFSAKLDDVVNYIPARMTAFLIIAPHKCKLWYLTYKQGKCHESPNAGYPIAAMGLSLNVKLGGNTSYFGKIKEKPYFGKGRKSITKEDIKKALALQPILDIFIILFLGLGVVL